jgi:hypothetical protein
MAPIGTQRRRHRVVELAVAWRQVLIAFQHNVNEVVARGLIEQLGGPRGGDGARRVGGHEGSGVRVDHTLQLRDRQVGGGRRQDP